MAIGVLIGHFILAIPRALGELEFYNVSIPNNHTFMDYDISYDGQD